MKGTVKLVALLFFLGVFFFANPQTLLAQCSTTAGPCSSLDDCLDPFPWPCDTACRQMCSKYAGFQECVSGQCWCVCDQGGIDT